MGSPYSFGDEFPTAPAWKPEPGDTVFGTIIDLDTYEGDYGGVTPVVTLEITADGATTNEGGKAVQVGSELRVFMFGAYLAGDFKKAQAQVGDTIGVKRYTDAEEATKPGYAKAKRYKLKVLSRGTLGAAVEAAKVEAVAAQAATPEPDPTAELNRLRAETAARNKAESRVTEPNFGAAAKQAAEAGVVTVETEDF